jgi:hypothetical protein
VKAVFLNERLSLPPINPIIRWYCLVRWRSCWPMPLKKAKMKRSKF